MRSTYQVVAAARMPERELLNGVRELARTLGWLTYHTRDSRGSEPGMPDLVVVGHSRCLLRELKQERGRLTADQREWLDALRSSGVDVGVWRPSDLLAGRVAEELQPRREDLSEHLLRERVADGVCPGPRTEAHRIVDHGSCRRRADQVIRIVRGESS